MIKNKKKLKVKYILKYINFFNNDINELNINDYLNKDDITNIYDISQIDNCVSNTEYDSELESDTDIDDDSYFASNPFFTTPDLSDSTPSLIIQLINTNDIIDQNYDHHSNIDQLF